MKAVAQFYMINQEMEMMEYKYILITLVMILLVASPVLAGDLRDEPAKQIDDRQRLDETYKVRETGVFFKGLRQSDPVVYIDRKVGTTYHVDSEKDFSENESVSIEFYYDIQPDFIEHYTHSGKYDRAYFPSQWDWSGNCTGSGEEINCNGGWVTINVSNIEKGKGSSTFPIGTTGPTWARDGQFFGDYNGVNSETNLNTISPSMNITTDGDNFTYSLWINVKEAPAQSFNLISFRFAGLRGSGIQLQKSGGDTNIEFITRNDTDLTILESILTSLNNWEYIVGTYNNETNNMTLYINGIVDNSALGFKYSNDTTSFEIGGNNILAGNTLFYNGSIDEVLVYNRTLSAAEVALLFANYTEISTGIERTGTPSTTGLILDINFDDFSVADNSGSGNNGVNTNVTFGTVFDIPLSLVKNTDFILVADTFTIINLNFAWSGINTTYIYDNEVGSNSSAVLRITGILLALTFIIILLIPIFRGVRGD